MIFIGFIIGLLARFFKPGNDRMGFVLTTLLGILGALFAGFLGRALGFYLPGEPAGFIASILGAVGLLSMMQYLRGR